jgi:hypothetical protein
MMIFVEKRNEGDLARHNSLSFSTEENFTRNKRTNDKKATNKNGPLGGTCFSLSTTTISLSKCIGEEEERISKTLLERVLRGRENPKTTLTRWVCE